MNLQAARLVVLDIEKFKRQIRYCNLPNGACADMALQSHGRYEDVTEFDFMGPMGIFVENFGLPVVINECLLQSYTGILRLFPNWPVNRSAEFYSLRAVGAFLVSSRCEAGRVTFLNILSEKGTSCRLYHPYQGASVAVYEQHGETRTLVRLFSEGEILGFDTRSGGVYTVERL